MRRYSIRKILLLIMAILLFTVTICFFTIHVNKITVEGNKQLSDSQVEQYLFDGTFGKNSLWVYAQKVLGHKVEMPFVEKYTVEFISPFDVKVTVIEKGIVGYIEYMESYMYFDKDGMVVESSKKLISGVPPITGLSFDYVVVHKKLPAKNEKIFDRILDAAKLVKKYEISVKQIKLDNNRNVTLYVGDIVAEMGNDAMLNEKVSVLNDMLPILKGKKGRLNMKQYQENGEYVLQTD